MPAEVKVSSQLKHRLIGTIVLVALLVIILPDVIDGKKDKVDEQFNAIPFAPEPAEQKPLMIDLSKNKQSTQHSGSSIIDSKSTHAAQSQTLVEKSTTKPTSSSKAPSKQAHVIKTQSNAGQKKETIIKEGWIIQLATLSSAKSATHLIEKLQRLGYQVHSYPETPVEGKLNRIFVGPELSKSKMEQMLTQLKKQTGLKGMIRHFDPSDH